MEIRWKKLPESGLNSGRGPCAQDTTTTHTHTHTDTIFYVFVLDLQMLINKTLISDVTLTNRQLVEQNALWLINSEVMFFLMK